MLKLPETGDEFHLVYSPLPAATNEIAVASRSILQMLMALATYVQVPEEDIDQKRTMSVPKPHPHTAPDASTSARHLNWQQPDVSRP